MIKIQNFRWAILAILLVFPSVLIGKFFTDEVLFMTDNNNVTLVKLTTSKCNIVLELYANKAPKTVANFLKYVDSGFYAGTIFHRVINGFMIQGGGLDANLKVLPNNPPIKNEADNELANKVGSIAMARTGDPDSATSQFFINVNNNNFLNFSKKSVSGWGYAVFGQVIEGMDVVNAIKEVETGKIGGYGDVPKQTIEIIKAGQL